MSVDAYIAARAAYVQADQNIDKIAMLLQTVVSALNRNRGRFNFANTDVGLPPEAIMERDRESVSADDWKTATQIMEALASWHATRQALIGDWSGLTADEQAALQPPPYGVFPGAGRR